MLNISKICKSAHISRQTYYNYCKKENKNFLTAKEIRKIKRNTKVGRPIKGL